MELASCKFRKKEIQNVHSRKNFVGTESYFPLCSNLIFIQRLPAIIVFIQKLFSQGLEGGVLIPYSRVLFTRIPHPALFQRYPESRFLAPKKIH